MSLRPSKSTHDDFSATISRELGGEAPPRDLKARRPWLHFAGGAAGGLTATFVTSPLDVVKTRLQSDFYKSQLDVKHKFPGLQLQPRNIMWEGARHFSETIQILRDVYKLEGWRALFKGLGPNLAGVVPARAINFFTYGNGKRILADRFNNGQESAIVHIFAAAFAGIATGTATNPIWLIKTRIQLDKEHSGSAGISRQYKNSIDCLVKVCKEEGIRGLYRGLSASYLGVTESTLQWVMYEQMKSGLARRKDRLTASGLQETTYDKYFDAGGKMGAAGAAKLLAAILTYPHEVVRTRLRLRPINGGRPRYVGLVQCFRTIAKEEGMIGLYGGLSPHLMRVVPSAVITFGMYEGVLSLVGERS
ncbi:mitochondrial carrier domain-containing protein [Geopyxis carbonaria]|nr:mitochondrial carrier domain-containing protein [Geopyxis carbonaria]